MEYFIVRIKMQINFTTKIFQSMVVAVVLGCLVGIGWAISFCLCTSGLPLIL